MNTVVVVANGAYACFITGQADQAFAYEPVPRLVKAAHLADPGS